MKLLLKSCLSQNNCLKESRRTPLWLLVCLIFVKGANAQSIGNYVNNGSFENYFVSFIHNIPYHWSALDSLKYYGELLVPPNKVPLSGYTYQYPYHGKNHLITSPYSNFNHNNRGYPRNRLKGLLQVGRRYCVTMYVNLSDQSTHGIDAIGIYFGDNSLDTIKKCTDPITYLMPQVQNPVGNIIQDTMNWVPVTGTFVAQGHEKYLLIGNFKSNANTDTLLVNPTNLPANVADYLIDAVSVIELDLPAYAGPDRLITPGDSAFIGREPDFAIDPGCFWFCLPGMIPLDTISGLWVRPAETTTYVVKQVLDCSTEKWDTVVVHLNPLGLEKLKAIQNDLRLFPVPAQDYVELRVSNMEWLKDFRNFSIYNTVGQLIREEELLPGENRISAEGLAEGVYSLVLETFTNGHVVKKLVIAR
jgi:hypothetical protein